MRSTARDARAGEGQRRFFDRHVAVSAHQVRVSRGRPTHGAGTKQPVASSGDACPTEVLPPNSICAAAARAQSRPGSSPTPSVTSTDPTSAATTDAAMRAPCSTVLSLLLCLAAWGGARPAGATRNASALLLTLDRVGRVVEARFPPSLRNSEVAIAVYNAFINSILDYDQWAVCDPQRRALNFWGQRHYLPVDVCMSAETYPILGAYGYMRVMEPFFPEPAANFGKLMLENGFDPEDRSMDTLTAVGMGNVIGTRIARFAATRTGWNADGEWSAGGHKKHFMDYTHYKPVNSPWELHYPLRWQPMMTSDRTTTGKYHYQSHVVPFLGWVRPMLLTREELVARYIDPPYESMNATRMSVRDAEKMDGLVREVMDASANLTPQQRYLARWWDNKLGSVGLIGPYYAIKLGFDVGFAARWFLGEMLAEYDALILAWKEKRRIDAVRPATVVNNLYAEETFLAYAGRREGVKPVRGKDWESLVHAQAHSEFPSGSAALCTSFAEHAELMLQELKESKGLSHVPPYKFEYFTDFVPLDSEGSPQISFDTPTQAAKSCANSRLWAGVHFPPAIEAGKKLVQGVGERAYHLVMDLSQGRIPKNCWWCTPQDVAATGE